MSYIAPSGNFITVDGGTDVIASGTLRLRLIFGSTSASHTMSVIDYGALEVDYNFIEEIGDITEFTINTPSIEFTVLNDLSQGASLINLITQLSANDIIVVEQTYTPSGGPSGVDYYYTTREQCEFKFLDRSVKINAKHPLKFGQIGFGQTWDDSLFSGKKVVARNVINDDGQGGIFEDASEESAIFGRDLIEQYLNALSGNTTLFYDSIIHQLKSTDTPDPSIPDVTMLIQDFDSITSSLEKPTELVKAMALSEAAIVGNVLGYSFFVPRFSKEYGVSLTADNLEELETDFSFKDVRNFSIFIRYGSTQSLQSTVIGINPGNEPEVINKFGANDVTVNFGESVDPLFISKFFTQQGSGAGPPQGFAYGTSTSVPNGFEDNVITAFKKIFRISSGSVDAGVMISGKILGIDTLKPYQHFSLSNTDPLVDGKDFRPAYLKYDLVNDIIEFEAYEF